VGALAFLVDFVDLVVFFAAAFTDFAGFVAPDLAAAFLAPGFLTTFLAVDFFVDDFLTVDFLAVFFELLAVFFATFSTPSHGDLTGLQKAFTPTEEGGGTRSPMVIDARL